MALMQGHQPAQRTGTNGAATPHHDPPLWTPRGGDFTDPLATPQACNGVGANPGTAFPPLPSPTIAGLLPLSSARGSGTTGAAALPPPPLMSSATAAALQQSGAATLGSGLGGGSQRVMAGNGGAGDMQAGELQKSQVRDVAPSQGEFASTAGATVGSSAAAVLGKRTTPEPVETAFNPAVSTTAIADIHVDTGPAR